MRLSVWPGVALMTGAVAVSHAWSAEPTKVTELFENDRVKVLHMTKSGPTHTTEESDDTSDSPAQRLYVERNA